MASSSTNQCSVGSDVSSATATRSTTVAYFLSPFGFESRSESKGNSLATAVASTPYLTIWPYPGRSSAGIEPVQDDGFASDTRRMSATRSSPNMDA